MNVLGRVLVITIVLAGSISPCSAKGNGSAAFDKIKSLSGEWVGKDPDGLPATITYHVTSGNTAILETLKPGKHPEMLSVYHLDGDHIMLTHYCSRNNQPRMRVEDYDPASEKMVFDFQDVTAANPKDSGHINGLVVKFPDKDHLIQEWSWTEGSDQTSSVFQFERKK